MIKKPMTKQPTFWKCDGGYAVGHPDDANPDLCNVESEGPILLLKSTDAGQTWHRVGQWQRAGRFNRWEIQWDTVKAKP